MAIMIETDGQTVGVVIDNDNKADKFIANFVCIREKLWETISRPGSRGYPSSRQVKKKQEKSGSITRSRYPAD